RACTSSPTQLPSLITGASRNLRLYRRATPDGNPRQLTSQAPGTPYGLAQATCRPWWWWSGRRRRRVALSNCTRAMQRLSLGVRPYLPPTPIVRIREAAGVLPAVRVFRRANGVLNMRCALHVVGKVLRAHA